ncbi:MAG: 5-oxoprolinase subunit PxpB [Defluviitaleaceae bacterium]|nr:5-oxoprolinase subunit PxpB [Defluviitaleaceae bacterium]
MAKYLTLGDKAIVVEFGQSISEELNKAVTAFQSAVISSKIEGITETFPSYKALTITYDPLVISYSELVSKLKESELNMCTKDIKNPNIIEIPVCYGGEFGPDIESVAEINGITAQEVVKIHTSKPYLIYMLGFMPGFSFLGELDKKINAPRLTSPRTKVIPGSVGIAGAQTGIYAIESPGGWQLIGRTPYKMFDPNREKPILYEAGDLIQFISITPEEYIRLE